MKLQLVTAPSLYPVSLAEAKDNLGVTEIRDNTKIYRYIGVAVLWSEQYLCRKLITQTWKYYLDSFPSGDLILPFGDLQSIAHIKYTDTDGTQSTFSEYSADTVSIPGRAVLDYGKSWPSATLQPLNPIEVQFVTGYTYNAVVGETVFDGVGLDDLTSGGSYTGTTPAVFEVEMQTAAAAAPDTFRWRKNRGAWTSGVAVTGAAQVLSDGVTVTFGATTGHTVGEGWEFFAGLTVPEDVRNAILLLVGHFYENREHTTASSVITKINTEIAMGAKSLLDPHRVWEWCA